MPSFYVFNFHLGDQTKVAYIKKYAVIHHLSSVSPDLILNLTKLCMNVNIGCVVILPFHKSGICIDMF